MMIGIMTSTVSMIVVIIVMIAAAGESTNVTGARFLKVLRSVTKEYRYS
jgi:hypothetical protein